MVFVVTNCSLTKNPNKHFEFFVDFGVDIKMACVYRHKHVDFKARRIKLAYEKKTLFPASKSLVHCHPVAYALSIFRIFSNDISLSDKDKRIVQILRFLSRYLFCERTLDLLLLVNSLMDFLCVRWIACFEPNSFFSR